MRITFLLPKYGWQPSGGFRIVYTYANHLAARGHDLTVVHPRRLPPGGWPTAPTRTADVRRRAGVIRDVLFTPRPSWIAIDGRVRMAYVPSLDEEHVPDGDAVIATWWSTAEAAQTLSARKGRRYHLVQGYEVWGGAEARVHAALRGPLHKIVISRWLADRLREIGVREEISLIPNAIDTDRFQVRTPLTARPPAIAMLYSREPYKGGDTGREILHRVRQRVPQLRAHLFGVGPAPKGTGTWMSYTRNATAAELSTMFNASALYLCPSFSEGWHLPGTEAMACGCAFVSSDIGGVRDYAEHDVTALLYEPGNAAAAAERCEQLLNDQGRRAALARRGIERVAQFSWQRSVDALCALLERTPGEMVG